MNLVDSYLNSSDYDYYGNAAEDTIIFFVKDEEAPNPESSEENASEDILTSGSIVTHDSNREDDELSISIPKMAEADAK